MLLSMLTLFAFVVLAVLLLPSQRIQRLVLSSVSKLLRGSTLALVVFCGLAALRQIPFPLPENAALDLTALGRLDSSVLWLVASALVVLPTLALLALVNHRQHPTPPPHRPQVNSDTPVSVRQLLAKLNGALATDPDNNHEHHSAADELCGRLSEVSVPKRQRVMDLMSTSK